MCDHSPNREAAMVVVRHDDNNIPTVWCDPCIAPLVDALQPIGTVASCCGHGKPGNIALADGRELMILPDFESARRAERLASLDIDMEALDRAYEHFAPKAMVVDGERTTRPAVLVGWAAEVIEHTLRQVLAALDGEGDMRRLCNHCGSTGVVSCEPSPCGHGGHPCERCDGSGLIGGEDT